MSRHVGLRTVRRPAAVACTVLAFALMSAACGGTAGSSAKGGGAAPDGRKAAARTPATAAVDLSSCGKDSRVVQGDNGPVTVSGTPKRVVALEFSFVDALANVGITPVGIADDGDPKRIIDPVRQKIGPYTSVGLRQSPNLQVIKSLKPDLIIADPKRDSAVEKQLESIATTVSLPSSVADYAETLVTEQQIGLAVNACDRMSAALAAHKKVMDQLKSELPAGGKGKVMFAVASEKAFSAQTPRGFAPTVLGYLGLETTPSSTTDVSVGMTLETMVTTAPDVLFVAHNTAKTLSDQWQGSSLWKTIPAVKGNADFPVDGNVWSKSRGTAAAELIAREAIKDLTGK